MKIDTITVTERKNKGNYEHIEISASAKVEEGENAMSAMLALKTFVETALMSNVPIPPEEVVKEEVKEEKSKKEKKPKKEKVEEVKVEAESAPEETPEESAKKTPPKSKVVLYSSDIKEHKSIFGGYLAKKYNDAWKTVAPKEDIQKFTSSLNGKEFLDDNGQIVESFLDLVHGFFG
jgi:hypothetical protein